MKNLAFCVFGAVFLGALPAGAEPQVKNSKLIFDAGFLGSSDKNADDIDTIRLTFSPISLNIEGDAIQQGRDVSETLEWNFNDGDEAKLGKVTLKPGQYILSSIQYTFNPLGLNTRFGSSRGYCLSEGTIGLEIGSGETLYLGQLQLNAPPRSPRDAKSFIPIRGLARDIDIAQSSPGWVYNDADLANIAAVRMADGAIDCPIGSNHKVAAWSVNPRHDAQPISPTLSTSDANY